MDPFVLSQIGGAVLGIGAAAFGEWWASADDDAKRELQEKASQIYENLDAPTLERLTAATAGESAYAGIPEDFGNRTNRNLALQQMLDIGSQGGMDAGSQLAVEQARRAAGQQEMQGRGAVRQEFQRRGLGGAAEASLQQQAQQGGADMAAVGDLQAASDARSRALQALATGGQMAGQAEGQDFQRAQAIAQSKDVMARFNAEQTGLANRYNAGLGQQNFDNTLQVKDRQYGAEMTLAEQRQRDADKKRRIAGGVGTSLIGATDSIGDYYGGKKKP
jgi:hypothetical protein